MSFGRLWFSYLLPVRSPFAKKVFLLLSNRETLLKVLVLQYVDQYIVYYQDQYNRWSWVQEQFINELLADTNTKNQTKDSLRKMEDALRVYKSNFLLPPEQIKLLEFKNTICWLSDSGHLSTGDMWILGVSHILWELQRLASQVAKEREIRWQKMVDDAFTGLKKVNELLYDAYIRRCDSIEKPIASIYRWHNYRDSDVSPSRSQRSVKVPLLIWDFCDTSMNPIDSKLYQIDLRVRNIVWWHGKTWHNEIARIMSQLDNLPEKSPSMKQFIWELRIQVQSLVTMEMPIVDRKIPQAIVIDTWINNTWDNQKEASSENLACITYIEKLFKNWLSHRLSSTKKNSHNTVWDGSFVNKCLRPFLQSVVQALQSNTVDIRNAISWNEIIIELEKSHSDPDQSRTVFRNILKWYWEKLSWQDNFGVKFIGAIQEYSHRREFDTERNHRKIPLSNVIKFLTQNPPSWQ